jgi:hypothetical protein
MVSQCFQAGRSTSAALRQVCEVISRTYPMYPVPGTVLSSFQEKLASGADT